MRWIIELFVVVVMLGAVVGLFSTQPQSPLVASSNRETAEQLYTNVARLFLDPGFLAQLENAICNPAQRDVLRSVLDASVGPQYLYNFTVRRSQGPPPACLACANYGDKLLSVARPREGFIGPYAWSATFRAVLPSGAQVEVFIGVGRP